MSKKLKAVFDAVIVKPTEQDELMHGSIIVPDLGKEKNLSGTIVSIGPGKHTITGELIPTTLEVGMKVVLPQMGPVKAEIEGEEYYICPEGQVLAVIVNEED
jgi:chaperonin GroES